jgi:hypothetical protein
MDIAVNYIAILVAGVVSMALGFFWYSPMILGKPWMKLMGYTEKSITQAQKEMGKMYILSFLAVLVSGYVLSHVMALSENFYGEGPVTAGMSTAFFMWFGFIAPIQLTDVIFGNKPWMLYAINTSYQLLSMLAMGVIIAIM